MAKDIESVRLALKLEKIVKGRAGLITIKTADFNPEIHNLAEIEKDNELGLELRLKKHEVFVWQKLPSNDDIHSLAEAIIKYKVTDTRLIDLLCSVLIGTGKIDDAVFSTKCFSYGQRIESNNTMNYLGNTRTGHDFRLWRHEYIASAYEVIKSNADLIGTAKKKPFGGQCPEKIEHEMLDLVMNRQVSWQEKYTRLLAFNYIAEGLRKEGYELAPIKMPKALELKLDEKLKAEFGSRWR